VTALQPIVLMYHRICADHAWRESEFVVMTSVFRAQMRFLASGNYYTPTMSEVLGWNGRVPRTGRTPVVITFDDGYAETYENALPVLRELGFCAAVFPVLDLSQRFNSWDSIPALRAPLLTPEDMREMEAAGIEFGSHTVTHPHLTRSTDAELADELSRSREILGSIVARPLPVLAYPYGDVDQRVKAAVREAGYSAALAVASGPLELQADPFEIRRQCVENSASEAYMRLVLSGARKVFAWSKWKVRARLDAMRRPRADRRAGRA